MTAPRSQSDFVHLLAYPPDRERFERAKDDMRAEMHRAPIQADVIREMLNLWELLKPLRETISTADGRRLSMSEAARYLIDHWETT